MSDAAPVPFHESVVKRVRFRTRHGCEADLFGKTGKRIVDLVLAVLLVPILAPTIGFMWLLVRLDGGPGLFGHARVGRYGQPFKCWKIRSMIPDAEARLSDYLLGHPEAAAEWVRDRKLAEDPRITRLGRFLRMTSLDELPQIWNVLVGDMSFVGPRPIMQDELERYGRDAEAYLSMKPGITGLWQVSGRSDTSYAERVILDLQYHRTACLRLDLKILAMTILAVLRGTGR